MRLPQELLDKVLDGCPIAALHACSKTCSALYHLAHPRTTRSITVDSDSGRIYDLLFLLWKCRTIPDTYRHTKELSLPPDPMDTLVNAWGTIRVPRFAMKQMFGVEADGMTQDDGYKLLADFDYSVVGTVFDSLQTIHLNQFTYHSPPLSRCLDSPVGPLKAGEIRVLYMNLCSFSSPDVFRRVLSELPSLEHLDLWTCGFVEEIPQANITTLFEGTQHQYRPPRLSALSVLFTSEIIFGTPKSEEIVLPLVSHISVPGALRSITTAMSRDPLWVEIVSRMLARHGQTLCDFTLHWIWGKQSPGSPYIFDDEGAGLAKYRPFVGGVHNML